MMTTRTERHTDTNRLTRHTRGHVCGVDALPPYIAPSSAVFAASPPTARHRTGTRPPFRPEVGGPHPRRLVHGGAPRGRTLVRRGARDRAADGRVAAQAHGRRPARRPGQLVAPAVLLLSGRMSPAGTQSAANSSTRRKTRAGRRAASCGPRSMARCERQTPPATPRSPSTSAARSSSPPTSRASHRSRRRCRPSRGAAPASRSRCLATRPSTRR